LRQVALAGAARPDKQSIFASVRSMHCSDLAELLPRVPAFSGWPL
jgi:hypothetical protein